MNFLFILPKIKCDESFHMNKPGIGYVAASLRSYGYPVFGLDLSRFENEVEAIRKAIYGNSIDVVCVGILAREYQAVEKVLTIVKQIKKEIKIILGGSLLSTSAEILMQNLPVDYGVIGQGEITICELADAIQYNGDLHNVNGLIFYDNASPERKLIKTAPREYLTNLDNLPYPCYEIFDFDNSIINKDGVISIVASRSCPFQCTFCYHPDSKYVQRSLDSVFDELDYWTKKYDKIKFVVIRDDLFSTEKGRLLEFCDRIMDYNLNYSVTLRVANVSEEIVRALHNSGCRSICYGLESADNRILQSMKKNITIEQIEKALKLTYDGGIAIEGFFIFGDVEETIETVNNTINWWLEHLQYRISLTNLMVYPGSKIYQYAVEKGIISDEVKYLKDECPVINISRLNHEDFDFLQRRLLASSNANFIYCSNVVINKREDDGTLSANVECFKCGHVNKHVKTNIERIGWYVCPTCYSLISFSARQAANFADYQKVNISTREITQNEYISVVNSALDIVFDRYAKENKKVVIWGAGARTSVMLMESENLRACTIKIVDKNFVNFKNETICSLPIESPEILMHEGCDCIVVTVVSKKDAVVEAIKNQFNLATEIMLL